MRKLQISALLPFGHLFMKRDAAFNPDGVQLSPDGRGAVDPLYLLIEIRHRQRRRL